LEEKVILRPKKNGFPIKSFDAIVRQFPRLKITSFITLRKALTDSMEDQVIGVWLPVIELVISSDRMTAQLYFNMTADEFEINKQQMIKQAEVALDEAGVVHGRKSLQDISFKAGEPIVA